jgi:hypothetical protein
MIDDFRPEKSELSTLPDRNLVIAALNLKVGVIRTRTVHWSGSLGGARRLNIWRLASGAYEYLKEFQRNRRLPSSTTSSSPVFLES